MPHTAYTYCQICEQACGLKVTIDNNRVQSIEPDKLNPNSWEDFCIKGALANKVVEHPNRLMHPMQRVGGRYVERSYEEAIKDISERFSRIIDESGPAAIASYAGNPNGMDFGGSLFLSIFMDAIGSHNRYWVSSLDQNALHYVAEKMYGHPFITMQFDLEECEFVLLIGANPAVSGMCWIGYNANGWKRLLAQQKAGQTKIVIADPRKTESAKKAAEHLAVNPDTDWALLLALIKVVFEEQLEDKDDCADAKGIDELRDIVANVSLATLATLCDIPSTKIIELAKQFATAKGAAAIARTGSAIGINGSLTEWLSHVLTLITGNLDHPGGRFYNPGLVDPLVAGDEIFKPNKTPSRVRGLPTIAGFHATAELPGEINTPGDDRIRALIISAGNPVVSGPNGSELDKAFSKLECLVAIDLVQRESHRHAHWLIPAAHWLEREEFNPLISSLSATAFAQMGKKLIDKPDSVRHEWEFLRDLAIAIGSPMMGFRGVNTVAKFSRLIAKITGNPYHAFGPAWISRLLVSRGGKARWKEIANAEHGFHFGEISYNQLRPKLANAERNIDAAPSELINRLQEILVEPVQTTMEFPLQLLSRRRRQTMNSWYSEVTANNSKDLTGDRIEIHPELAEQLGLSEGQAVSVTSRCASIKAKVGLSNNLKPLTVVMEQGWGSRVFNPNSGEGHALGVNRNLLVANDELDPLTNVPRLNGTQVRIDKADAS